MPRTGNIGSANATTTAAVRTRRLPNVTASKKIGVRARNTSEGPAAGGISRVDVDADGSAADPGATDGLA